MPAGARWRRPSRRWWRPRHLNAHRRDKGEPELALDVVLHYGEVVYGNVGAARRLDFTVIGPTVNEASRIEGLCAGSAGIPAVGTPFAGRRSRAGD